MERVALQGVTNIIRFNWHFYLIAIIAVGILSIFHLPFIICLIVLSTLVSLGVSWYVYDYTNLYTLDWLDAGNPAQIININAGFDETSTCLAAKFPAAKLTVYDFYDASKHTEISIERARKAYGAYPGTIVISTSAVPSSSADLIVVIFAAHEIRDRVERSLFFMQLSQSLNYNGQIIVLEHLRDLPNFMAYNIGFFHFFSRLEWLKTISAAGLIVAKETKLTPFLSAFILQRNGITS